MDKLTNKQEAFVQNLVKGDKQREAYKKAYNAVNMKESTIDERASRLIRECKISARYNELREKVIASAEKKVIITVEEILTELKNIAFSKKDKEIRTGDRLKAMELAGKHLAMYTDRVDSKTSGELDIRLIKDE